MKTMRDLLVEKAMVEGGHVTRSVNWVKTPTELKTIIKPITKVLGSGRPSITKGDPIRVKSGPDETIFVYYQMDDFGSLDKNLMRRLIKVDAIQRISFDGKTVKVVVDNVHDSLWDE